MSSKIHECCTILKDSHQFDNNALEIVELLTEAVPVGFTYEFLRKCIEEYMVKPEYFFSSTDALEEFVYTINKSTLNLQYCNVSKSPTEALSEYMTDHNLSYTAWIRILELNSTPKDIALVMLNSVSEDIAKNKMFILQNSMSKIGSNEDIKTCLMELLDLNRMLLERINKLERNNQDVQ